MTGLNNQISANDANLGVVHTIRVLAEYTLGNGGTAVIGKVPANAIIVDAGIVVDTAFNAATTNTADIGTAGTPTGLGSALAAGTIGRILADEMATATILRPSEDQEMQVRINMTGAAATAGALYAYVNYVIGND